MSIGHTRQYHRRIMQSWVIDLEIRNYSIKNNLIDEYASYDIIKQFKSLPGRVFRVITDNTDEDMKRILTQIVKEHLKLCFQY